MDKLMLLLETSTATCSVAVCLLRDDGTEVLAEATGEKVMQHTAILLPLIEQAFAKTSYKLQDIAAVAVSGGPGSYTALRAGMSSAKGLALALDIPLIKVPTHLALAASSVQLEEDDSSDKGIAVWIWARKTEGYRQVFNRQLVAQGEIDVVNFGNESAELAADQATHRIACWANDLVPLGLVNTSVRGLETSARHLAVPAARAYQEEAFEHLATAEPTYVKSPFITRAKPKLPTGQ